jgi:hypothetical protein
MRGVPCTTGTPTPALRQVSTIGYDTLHRLPFYFFPSELRVASRRPSLSVERGGVCEREVEAVSRLDRGQRVWGRAYHEPPHMP